jgi:uncharacterized protein YjbI with pentapeptide repeats
LLLDGVKVDLASEVVRAHSIQITESKLRGVTLDAPTAPGLRLTDVVLRDCDLSNVDGREGSLTRVEITNSRLVGFGLAGGKARDLKVLDSTLSLGSFAFAELRNVLFERVNLREASFMDARLDSVTFIDCELEPAVTTRRADFRGVTLTNSTMRGTALDSVLGVESLRGLTMPWSDVLSSAAALAAAVGINIEPS